MDVIFLHGTTQSPAGWGRVSDRLDALGHRTFRPDLSTDDPDAVAADHLDLVRGQVAADVRDPVVVAHSGAGLLLPAVAAALRARHTVWVGAAVPDPGGASFLDQIAAAGEEILSDEWRTLAEPPTQDPVTAAYFLFHDCDLATLRWGLSTVRLWHPMGLYGQAAQRFDPSPATFVLPARDRTLRPEWMRRVARERLGARVVEVDSGHCPQVSRPRELADLVHGLDAPPTP
ncbi:alpha/beta hydrolase family protein [Nocardiopsis sp. Huas11]|uniref:alpha/beta fold hydrolase n=1 Tax=Nocardiopsis sp. Huas11 TaxID=2183912 RepID=UPI000EB01A81|nr:alpha/beta hydrolase [Nocardiopsis sp. Huas11]RKS05734.1 alpha/beta hydrolase family protein [Nocardiopsis sp. Huas11]